MDFPFVVIPSLTERQMQRYHRHIDSGRSGWHRKWTESVWRRHQHESNAMLSGWQSPLDRRRRLVHFYDEYGTEQGAFVLRHSFLWLNLTLPSDELDNYHSTIGERLLCGGWTRRANHGNKETWSRGRLQATLTTVRTHDEDLLRGYVLPPSYRNLTLVLSTTENRLPAGLDRRAWNWFHDVGLRPILPRGEPTFVQPEELAAHFPAQLELGCGPSTEAGIPHLSNLHRTYGVSRGDFSFVFHAQDDGLLDVLSTPEEKFVEFTAIYRACVTAEPTTFHHDIKYLVEKGMIVGPVITNNFDCLCADVGLEEVSLRRYDAAPYFPAQELGGADSIRFHPRARSLLVVGVHADRRLAQMRARDQGLTVIYIDPERYISPAGQEISYPVEAPQTGDQFVKMSASEALGQLVRSLSGNG